jgi:hypothetical protein
MVPREELIEWLNAIEWQRPEEITPEAEAFIGEHVRLMRPVIQELMARQEIDAVEAYGFAQSAGHDTPEGECLLDDLFTKVSFQGAGVRESLIANITACYCWELDPDLGHLPNPWTSLVELYGIGYTTSGEDDPDGQWVTLTVGFRHGERSFPIIGAPPGAP